MKQRLLILIAGVFAVVLIAAVAAQTYTIMRLNDRLDQLTAQASQQPVASPPPVEVASAVPEAKTEMQAAPATEPEAAPSPAEATPRTFPSIARSIHKSGPAAADANGNGNGRNEKEQESRASDLVPVPPQNSAPSQRLRPHPGLLQPPQIGFGFNRLDPFEEIRRMESMMQSMFDNQLGAFAQPRSLAPNGFGANDFGIRDFQWTEDGDHYVLRAELPGVDEQKLRIDITDTSVRISGQQEMYNEVRDETGTVVRRESRSGSFNRTTPLPGAVQVDRAQHQVEDGVLTIRLPKAKQSA